MSALQTELAIAPRTYRKYRQILQDLFPPFRRRDGTSSLLEVVDGDERYLRLRPLREVGNADPDLEFLAAAIHFARSLLKGTGDHALASTADTLLRGFHAAMRDRDFLLSGLLADAERMFVVAPHPGSEWLGVLVTALLNRHMLRVQVMDETPLTIMPLTLSLQTEGPRLIAQANGKIVEFMLSDLTEIEVLEDIFDYPNAGHYHPRETKSASES